MTYGMAVMSISLLRDQRRFCGKIFNLFEVKVQKKLKKNKKLLKKLDAGKRFVKL